MAKRLEPRGSFWATDDAGKRHRIRVLRTIIDAGSGDELEGLATLRTDDGHAVNVVSKGQYFVPATGLTLRSDDPDAP